MAKYFCGILYPDEDPSHLFALQFMRESKANFCYITHDRDLDDNGDLKKSHVHYIIKFPNERYVDNVARLLGVDFIYVQECIDFIGAEKYLLHTGLKNKYQYRIDEVYGPLKVEVEKHCFKSTEGDRVLMLLNVLDTLPYNCSYRDFLVACCQAGLYTEFRRLGSGTLKLLESHNSKYF